MTDLLQFHVMGAPRGKGRPKFSTRGGFVRTYTDDQTAAYENLVALACVDAMGKANLQVFDRPVSVTVYAYMAIPKSASRSQREAMLANEARPGKKPDLDNVVKAVLDGCNTVAFRDDALVTSIIAHKVYSDTPRVTVEIKPDTTYLIEQ